MKGFLAVLLVLASTGMVDAQQTRREFSSPDFSPPPASGSSTVGDRENDFSTRTNQTRLAALQSDSRSSDASFSGSTGLSGSNSKYVIMDDNLATGSADNVRRSEDRFTGGRRTDDQNLSGRQRNNREVDDRGFNSRGTDRSGTRVGTGFDRNDPSRRQFFGPENDPRIRNAVREQPRFAAQSSARSQTSVLNSQRRGSGDRDRLTADRSSEPFKIYDLEITPNLEYDLKRNGYLYAQTDLQQSRSDQLRLFGDRQRSSDIDRESKVFASKVDTYQGNLVIDIDDYALEQIENGSYTLDDFDRFDARGVILRYVDRNNGKIDLQRIPLTGTAGDRVETRRERRDVDAQSVDYRRSDADGDGRFVLPRTDREVRQSNVDRVNDSSARRNYQDRMADIYRENTRYPRNPILDRRDSVLDSERDLLAREAQEVREMRLQREALAREAREIEAENRELRREMLFAQSRSDRYGVRRDPVAQFRPVDLDGRSSRPITPVTAERFADRQFEATGATRPSYLSEYSTIPPIAKTGDPEFDYYERQNQDQLSRIKRKMAAISQSSKLAALESGIDLQFQKQQTELAAAKNQQKFGTVASFNDDGLVRGTLGGNLAAGQRYRVAANSIGNGSVGNGGVSELSMRPTQTNYQNGAGHSGVNSGSSDKLVRALWLVAFLSIGMNAYLALLARSFYARYNELADELRETFTASV